MEKIKTGLAAFGMSGQIFHAPFISTNPAFCLTAITERSKELSKERYPSARIVRSFEELVALDELELVVINTPDSTHYEYARKALEAGKNVIVEKPFTTTVEQGQELVDLARSKGLAISVYQNRRWESDFHTVRDILDKGLLGRLVEFESTFPRYRNFIKPGTWKETGELGGGLTYNLGAHVIDQAVQLFGVPEAVFADIDIIRTGGMVDDYFVIHLLRPSKAPHVKVTLKSSYLMCEPEPRFVLQGTDGAFGKYGRDRAAAVADIQGRGFQYLPARRPRQVAQMVLGLLVLMLQLLHDRPGCTVAELPAGHVPVFDVYDGVLRVAAGHIVDDHLALVAELRRDARGDLLQRF